MDLNLLKLLPVLADEKSVTKAADRLFMSQSGLQSCAQSGAGTIG